MFKASSNSNLENGDLFRLFQREKVKNVNMRKLFINGNRRNILFVKVRKKSLATKVEMIRPGCVTCSVWYIVIGVYVCLRLWLAAHLCDHCVKGKHRLLHKDVNVIIIVRTALVHSA